MERTDGNSAEGDDSRTTAVSIEEANDTGQSHTRAGSAATDRAESVAGDPTSPKLVSRILVTWIELTIVGITGGLFGATVGGPLGFISYLATTLLTVGIIFYNVNELVREWFQATT